MLVGAAAEKSGEVASHVFRRGVDGAASSRYHFAVIHGLGGGGPSWYPVAKRVDVQQRQIAQRMLKARKPTRNSRSGASFRAYRLNVTGASFPHGVSERHHYLAQVRHKGVRHRNL